MCCLAKEHAENIETPSAGALLFVTFNKRLFVRVRRVMRRTCDAARQSTGELVLNAVDKCSLISLQCRRTNNDRRQQLAIAATTNVDLIRDVGSHWTMVHDTSLGALRGTKSHYLYDQLFIVYLYIHAGWDLRYGSVLDSDSFGTVILFVVVRNVMLHCTDAVVITANCKSLICGSQTTQGAAP